MWPRQPVDLVLGDSAALLAPEADSVWVQALVKLLAGAFGRVLVLASLRTGDPLLSQRAALRLGEPGALTAGSRLSDPPFLSFAYLTSGSLAHKDCA
jgi:hypothetical protein